MVSGLHSLKKQWEVWRSSFNFTAFVNFKDYLFLPLGNENHEYAKIHWLVRLRWLALVFLLMLAPLIFVFGMPTELLNEVYISVLGLLFCFNVFTQWVWQDKKGKIGLGIVAFQLIVDLVALTSLVSSSGGTSNPFYILFFVNILLGAILLDGIWGFLFLALCHLALSLAQVVSFSGGLSSTPAYLIQHLVLLISWGVSRSLGRYIEIQKEEILQIKVYAEKMDHLRAMGAMTAGFSHKFASPLNSIKLRLDRELRACPNSLNLQEMNLAVADCEMVLRLFNRAQMDPRDIQLQVCSLSVISNSIIDSWRHENPLAKIEFNLKTAADKVRVQFLSFTHALINLLNNASEASPEGEIIIGIHQQQSNIFLTIENKGSSFSEDVLNRFGEPFVTTKPTGTGLGLYSVQLFAQSSGGKASISNSPIGAKVEIQIPQYLESGV